MEIPDKHYLNQMPKVSIKSGAMLIACTLDFCDEVTLYLCVLPPQNPELHSIMRKTSDKSQLRSILQNTWPVPLPPRQDMGAKEQGPHADPPQLEEVVALKGNIQRVAFLPVGPGLKEPCPRTTELCSFVLWTSTLYPLVPLNMLFSLVSLEKGLSGIVALLVRKIM